MPDGSDIILSMVSAIADVRAAMPADVAALHAIRSGCERWLAARGVEQWVVGEVSPDDIAAQVERRDWFVGVDASDTIIGALRYLSADNDVWSDAIAGDARYVHGLMTDRRAAAAGSGSLLLSWAENRATTEGFGAMRLDCVESNRALRAFYRSRGYAEVGRRDFNGAWFSVVRFEKSLVQ